MPKPPKPPDLTDRLAAGTLPDDLTADTEPMDPPTSTAPQPQTKAQPTPPPEPKARRLADLLPEAFTRILRRKSGAEVPIPLPWPTVAEPLGGGLWPGLHVLVGNTAAGKTQWCLQTAIHAAQQGTPTLYVALEAGDVEFVARCLGLVAKTHWNELYHGTRVGLERLIEQHTPALKELPLDVLLPEPHGWSAHELLAEVAALRAANIETSPGSQPLLVILDFLQIIGTTTDEDLRERIGKAAYVGRGVARKYNAAVVLASSTSRENYLALTGRKRGKSAVEPDKENKLGGGHAGRFVGLGKESGEIEYAADTVLVLTQEPWEDNTAPHGGTKCHLALAKVRAGKPKWVKLRFDGLTFTPWEDDVHGTVTV